MTDELQRLAKAASSGPWTVDERLEAGCVRGRYGDIIVMETELLSDAAFIAAANPETIRALLSERAELLATVERMRGTAAVVLPAMEWADAHIGGRTKYETAQQVVNCLEAYDDALDALRTALTTGEGK